MNIIIDSVDAGKCSPTEADGNWWLCGKPIRLPPAIEVELKSGYVVSVVSTEKNLTGHEDFFVGKSWYMQG